ncbi:FitA-like ribbon-helix-helix domain-containing protein [Endozoicomonas euniceicola]|uniref:DNA-binding protein n=1 Tax=Endozoicomonas euniceicola TaxID=1234143 RepID=A0ABY6H0W2_9GAMM|nr:DNA-binding protein [Endozoicomonas euniceicola]UYM18555.1 DNA-binding protein [Endozoicomonas euniceicola]
MANLIVRNIDEKVVDALKTQADKHEPSVEAEHRRVLESALPDPRKKSFTEALENIPDVGTDADFERINDGGERDVFY